jgi:chorismate dehydratase
MPNRDYLVAFPTFAAKFKLIELDRKIRVGAVSYLNTKPLLYGIENSPVFHEISLITDYPARIAGMLLNDEIDIGLVPVSIIPQMKEYHFNTEFCIGSDGPVASVGLFSEVPIQEIRKVMLDYQSRTSVILAEILFEKHWKQNPDFVSTDHEFLQEIKGNTAAVVIGDRALEQRKKSRYFYDLGEEWKKMTGLPFVFAAWISNKMLDPDWIHRFNDANAFGIQNILQVINVLPPNDFDLLTYYSCNLSYNLDENKRLAMKLFLEMLSEQDQTADSINGSTHGA